MIEINNKKYRNLQEQVKKNQDDIADIVERGGKGYSAGASIVITEGDETDTIDVKSGVFIKDDDTSYSSLFRGKGVWVKAEGAYTSTSYGDGAIGRSIPNQPGYTYNLPNKSGTVALTSDIPEEGHYMYIIHIFFHNDRDYQINVPITSSHPLTNSQSVQLNWEDVLPYISEYTVGVEDEYNADFGLMGYFYGLARATTNRYFSWMGNDHNDLVIGEIDPDLDITMEDVTYIE